MEDAQPNTSACVTKSEKQELVSSLLRAEAWVLSDKGSVASGPWATRTQFQWVGNETPSCGK
jgi:hypothetical protein